MRTYRVSLAVLVLTLSAGFAMAQSLTGSIEGTVRDEQGGVLPGVAVTLTGKTGSKTLVTDGEGHYRFLAVEPGAYSLAAELSGFQGRRTDNLVLNFGKTLSVDFSLKVAGFAEAIAVTGEAPVVDVTSTESTNNISQDLLFNIPINRNTGTAVLNYTPGINNDVAFGGDTGTANALLLDGVDTRDPQFGSAWTFYNYNLIEEVQVSGLGANAEYGSFTGAVVNTITKSGGNKHAALFDAVYSRGSFSSDNITEEIVQQNPFLAVPAKTRKYLDLTAQVSGPLMKDKLFFFVSAQRYELDQDPTGPRTNNEELSPRFNLKLTWQPSTSDTVTTTVQYDSYSIIGRSGVGAAQSTDDLTNNEAAPEWVWGATWRHLFGSKTFLELKFTGYDGYYDLNPKVQLPGHFDGATGQFSVSQGWFYYADRSRNQVNVSLNHYAEAFGRHDLKFGVEIERSRLRSRYGLVDGITYYDYAGYPYLAYNYGYDVSSRIHREAFYAQDSWKVSDRLTINPGVRFTLIRGIDTNTDEKVYDVKPLEPRIGFAFDLTGDQKTVLRAHYGQYYEGGFTTAFDRVLSGQLDRVTYDPTLLPARVEIDRSPASLYRLDPEIKHPRVDQFTFGIERALTPDFKLAVTGIFRKNKNVIGSVIPSARWTPTTVTEGLRGQPLGVFRWANVAASESDLLITNPEGFEYRDPNGNVLGTAEASRKYRGLEVVLSKRLSKRWQAQASYVLSKTEGTVDNGADSSIFGYNFYFFETPTLALVNSKGPLEFDRRHEVKVLASYQVPKIDLGVNVYYRYLSGRTYSASQRFSSTLINFPPSSSGRQPWIEPLGSRRIEAQSVADLRVEKIFKLGGRGDRISVYADITNLFNAGTILRVFRRFPFTTISISPEETADVEFGAPATIIAPRQVNLGVRWWF